MDLCCLSLVCLDAHLPRPGWSREDLELLKWQGTLTALRTGKEGGGRKEEGKGRWGGDGNF